MSEHTDETAEAEITPTGIPVKDCPTCGHRHPITRPHCPTCGLAHQFQCPKEKS